MTTILIIEDHKDFREALRHFLQINSVKAHMLEASSGEEGVIVAKRARPEIILMDFWLRGINGMEAAQQIKAHDAACSIIMLSMFDAKDITQLGDHRWVKTFINKSELCDKLIPTITKILNPPCNQRTLKRDSLN